MNSSTLPPLLKNYVPNYEQTIPNSLARDEETDNLDYSDEEFENSSNEVEKKLKSFRAAQKRQMEAEEKAYKEREEKALHTLKMWNIVKENERRRKQKLLKDRVELQHQIIRKQDELHEALEKQQRESKDLHHSAPSKLQEVSLPVGLTSQAGQNLHKRQAKPRKTKPKTKVVVQHIDEQTIQEVSEDEKHSEVSVKDAFSEEDLSEFIENDAMEEADFQALRYQPLNVQLEKLFGDKAEGFLNPTVKESPRKTFDPTLAKRKGQHGATALWETLRDFSRQKLRNKDALILPDVKNAYSCFVRECLRRHITPVKRNFVSEEETPVNVNLEESDLLKDVRFRRHRQELMYRIAHINKEKTKLLFQAVGPPDYVEEWKDKEGIRRFCPQLMEKSFDPAPPLITLEDDQCGPRLVHVSTSPDNRPRKHVKSKDLKPEKQSEIAGAKLYFLTEKEASSRGQFAKRLTRDHNDDDTTQFKHSRSADILREDNAKKPEFLPRLWEPLSMDALLDQNGSYFEQQNSIFRQDLSKTWRVPS